jgi:chromosome partitioning protein
MLAYSVESISPEGGWHVTDTITPRIIALVNLKGGVGKTTSALFIADGLAAVGYRVLLVDMDPQSNATYTILRQLNQGPEDSLYEVLSEQKSRPLQEIIKPTSRNNLYIAPGSVWLSSAEIELISVQLREFKLKVALEEVKPYFHFVIIDTPPNLGILTVNSLVASTDVIIPVTLKVYGLVGINILLTTLDMLRKKFSPFGITLPIMGVLITQVRDTINSRERFKQVQALFGDRLFKTLVPLNEKLEEANDQELSGYSFAPDAKGVRAYAEIVKEVIARAGQQEGAH